MPSPVTNAPAVDHVVQFYDDDAVLIATLADYVGTGLATGQACLVIATPDHRDALEERLRATGPDLAAARAGGQYVAADAEETLGHIEVSGDVDPQRFAEAVGALFGRLRSERPLRVFGEMVGLLLARGRSDATVRLEEFWNALRTTHAFELLCAYPLASLGGRALAHPIVEICARHSRVIPAGSARPLDEAARLRAIVALQQQASALQAEVVESNAAETALRAVKEELEVQVEDLRRLHEMAVRLTGNLDVESVLR
ncbi:MAG TPA: MEDS domain-containing protein, partial [Candidatus Dormibacteraeota bacterium]|nr:MEDS domain-containing protein [Candidatus Dormibacteraeota bacterium]